MYSTTIPSLGTGLVVKRPQLWMAERRTSTALAAVRSAGGRPRSTCAAKERDGARSRRDAAVRSRRAHELAARSWRAVGRGARRRGAARLPERPLTVALARDARLLALHLLGHLLVQLLLRRAAPLGGQLAAVDEGAVVQPAVRLELGGAAHHLAVESGKSSTLGRPEASS